MMPTGMCTLRWRTTTDRRIDASTANRKSAQRPGDHRADGHAHTNICSGTVTAATTAHISVHAADNRSGRAR
jgi:hypothetical protein